MVTSADLQMIHVDQVSTDHHKRVPSMSNTSRQDNAFCIKTMLFASRQCFLHQDNAFCIKTMLFASRQCFLHQDNALTGENLPIYSNNRAWLNIFSQEIQTSKHL
jgi:hypothetical protein